MGPNKYQLILIIIIGILWLGVGSLIYLDALRKQKLSWKHILFPAFYVKFDRKDWVKFLSLIAAIVGLCYLVILLE